MSSNYFLDIFTDLIFKGQALGLSMIFLVTLEFLEPFFVAIDRDLHLNGIIACTDSFDVEFYS
jgi:hypothetical protein